MDVCARLLALGNLFARFLLLMACSCGLLPRGDIPRCAHPLNCWWALGWLAAQGHLARAHCSSCLRQNLSALTQRRAEMGLHGQGCCCKSRHVWGRRGTSRAGPGPQVLSLPIQCPHAPPNGLSGPPRVGHSTQPGHPSLMPALASCHSYLAFRGSRAALLSPSLEDRPQEALVCMRFSEGWLQ